MNFITSFLEGHDELFVALGDMPATVNDDEGGFDGGHDFFFFCAWSALARPLAWRIYQRFTNSGKSEEGIFSSEEVTNAISTPLCRRGSSARCDTAVGFENICGRRIDWLNLVYAFC